MTDKPAHPRQGTGASHPSRSERDLRERVKELTCLYTVNRDMQEQLSVDEFCARVVEHLIPATQFPEITVPVIELGDRRFTSAPRRKKLSYGLHAPINVAGEAQGRLSVYYTEDRPFVLPDEQNLVNAVAEALGAWLERTQAQQDLKESAEKYRLIADNTSDLVAVTTFDSNPTFKYVSPSHRRLLGYESAELLHKPALDFVHRADKKSLLTLLSTYLKAKSSDPATTTGPEPSETLEYRARARSGDYYWLESTVDLMPDGMLFVSRDVTERRHQEEELRASRDQTAATGRLLLALGQAAQAVQRGHTTDEVYRTVLDELERLGYHAAIFTFSEDRTHLVLSYLTFESALVEMGEKLVGLSAKGYRIPVEPGGIYERIMTTAQPSFSEPAAESIAEGLPAPVRPLARRLASLLGIEQIVRVPLAMGGEVHGLLAVTGRGLSEDDLPAITAFANQTAIAVENARLYQETRARAAELASSEARYRALFDHARDGLFVTNMQGRHVDANRAACELLGYSQEELLELDVFDVWVGGQGLSPQEPLPLLEQLRAIWDEGMTGYETELITKSGQRISVEMTITPLDYQGQKVVLTAARDVTARKQAEAALRQSEEAYRQLVENANDIIYSHDLEGNFTAVNPAALRTYGYSAEEAASLNIGDIVDPHYLPLAQRKIREKVRGPGRSAPYELLTHTKRGESIWVEVNTRLATRHGHPLGVQGVARDITARKRAEAAARESEQRYRTLFEQSRDPINITTREGKILEVNESFLALFGYTAEETTRLNAVELYADPADRKGFQKAIEQKGAVRDYQVMLRKKDGSEIDCLLTSTVRRGKDGNVLGYQGIIRDITEQKRTEEAIKRLAYHDPLTGLPNRILFSDRLGVALAEARRSNRPHAVMLLDLDHFKKVNDTLGHTMGDRLLQAVAERLTTLLRESDTICRMGGDEFLLSITGIARSEDGELVANKILQSIRKPFVLDGRELLVTTSLGVAVYPDDGQDVDTLIRNADTALYQAKQEGRDNYQRYTAREEEKEATFSGQVTK